MALALALLAIASLIFVAALLADGVRVLLARHRREAACPLELVVCERREVAGQLVCLTLARAEGGRLPPFAAGQHVLLQAPAGRGSKIVQRAYSLAAWTRTPHRYELAIKREAKGLVSGWACEQLQAGSKVTLLPPRGDFVLAPDDTGELVLIAGGIGITPLRAMLHAALAARRQRRIVLFHAARSAAELLYREEFMALASATGQFNYRPLLSRPDASWIGDTGRLDTARIVAALHDGANAAFYLCASGALMDSVRLGLLGAGIAKTRIHREAFGVAATGDASSGQRIALEHGERSHNLLTAGEATLLAALETHELAPPAECRAGNCGQCRMRLLDGEVRWLMKPEVALADGDILPCICTAVGDLRLTAAR